MDKTMQVIGVINELRKENLSDDEIVARMTARLHMYEEHNLTGVDIQNRIAAGIFTPKQFAQLTDEEFTTLVFDFKVSDREMGKIFDISPSTVRSRRQKLKLERNSKDSWGQMAQWICSDRIAPDLNEFLDKISA